MSGDRPPIVEYLVEHTSEDPVRPWQAFIVRQGESARRLGTTYLSAEEALKVCAIEARGESF